MIDLLQNWRYAWHLVKPFVITAGVAFGIVVIYATVDWVVNH